MEIFGIAEISIFALSAFMREHQNEHLGVSIPGVYP
jgi:hypothetical protein